MNPTSSAAFKTLVNLAVGSLAPIALSLFDHPTGGLATALATNPVYAAFWGAASYLSHNLYDHYFGAPVASSSTH